MAWPIGAVNTTNLDANADKTSRARSDLNSLIVKTNEIILARPQLVLGAGGSTLSFKLLTQNMWLGAGPTGSGATLIWSALNNVNPDAYAIVCMIRVYGTLTANAWVRPYGGSTGPSELQRCFSLDTTNDPPMALLSAHIIIPVSDRRFDLNQNHGSFDAWSDFRMILVGYIK